MAASLSRSMIYNVLWSFIGRFGYLAIALVSNIVLVRLLGPKEFGQLGIVMFFIVIAAVIVESGLAGALVRKQDASEIDYSTIFIFNLAASLLLTAIIAFSAHYVAIFYDDAQLTSLIVVSSSLLIINSIRLKQTTKLIKDLRFKKKAVYDVLAIAIGSSVAIFLGYSGAGVWALVGQQLATAVALTSMMLFFEEPLKSYKFSWISFRGMYRFGVNTTLASLLNTFFDNIYQLVIAKYFSIFQAGFYYQAKKLQEMPTGVLSSTMLGVVYSALSRLQAMPERFNALYSSTAKLFTIVVAFMCLVIFVYAELLVVLLYGDEWLQSAYYLKILIVIAFFYLQEMFNRVVFKVFDKTEKILQLEILKKAIQAVTVWFGIYTESIEVLLYGFLLTSSLSFLVNYYYARKVQKYDGLADFINICKVLGISIATTVASLKLIEIFNIEGPERLWLFPVIIIVYIGLLSVMGVVRLRKDFRNIMILLKVDKNAS